MTDPSHLTDASVDELIALLGSNTHSDTNAATEELARRGVPDAFDAVWRSIRRDCGWEFVPKEKAAAAGRIATLDDLRRMAEILRETDGLLEELERRAEEDPDDADSGDEEDEIHRTMQAARRVLTGAGSRAVPLLLDLLESGGVQARGYGAALALRDLADPDLGPALRSALARETEPEVQELLITALEACVGEDACDAVERFLTPGVGVNSGMPIRAAARILVRYRGEAVLPELLALARHDEPFIRAGSVAGLEALPHPEARRMLEALLDDSHPRVRMLAGRALKDLSED